MCLQRGRSKISRSVLLLLGLSAVESVGRAEAFTAGEDLLGISGTARVSFFTKDKTFVDDAGAQCDSLWITARPREFAGARAYFDARVQAQLVNGNSEIHGDLREGYVEKAMADFDLKLGRQVLVWGRADKINPTDSWSVRNYKLLVTDDEDQRVGTAAVQGTWNIGSGRLIGIWQPEFRAPILPIPPQPAGAELRSIVVGQRAGQLGVKFDHSGTGFDWSLSYAHAINRTPDLALLGSGSNATDPSRSRLGLAYKFADVVGADAALPVGKFGLRGEIAYTHARNPGGANPLAQNSNVFAVVGAERTWLGELNVNVQYLFKRSFYYRSLDSIADPVLQSIARQARLISNQLAATMQGASVRINYKALNETLETELSAAMWFEKKDSFVGLKLSYAFTDRVKGIIGANMWAGPTDSFFGRLRNTSAAFVEFRIGL